MACAVQVLEISCWDDDVGRPDDLISRRAKWAVQFCAPARKIPRRVELPLRDLDLTGATDDVWLTLPRAASDSKRAHQAGEGGGGGGGVQARAVLTRAEPPAGVGGPPRREDTAHEGSSSPVARHLSRPSIPGAADQLRSLVGLSSKECRLHLRCAYVRFSAAEATAAAAGPDAAAEGLTRSSATARALRMGVLQIHVERATDLATKTQHGFTKVCFCMESAEWTELTASTCTARPAGGRA